MARRRIHSRLEGYEKAWRRAGTIEKALKPILAVALHAEAKRIMNKSKAYYVPIRQDYGALLASSYVNNPEYYGTVIDVEIGYGGTTKVPYATFIHEHPRSGKTHGFDPQGNPYPPRSWATTGQWKYLEEPAHAMMPTSAQRIATDVYARLQAFQAL